MYTCVLLLLGVQKGFQLGCYRRQGLGGSDAASVLGISPFRTAMDLYYDKRNLPIEDDEGNWVAMEVGTLLEDLVARIFAKKTGLKIYRRKCMFQHPAHPWMLADLDFLVEMPDGSTAILECKTTNYNARDKWEYDGKPIVPVYYESQGRHYMAVMNLNRVYYCCLYGNNEEEVIIRHIDRDMDYESELISLEEDFWLNHVQAQVPPPYFEDDGELILESLRRLMGPSSKDAPPVLLTPPQSAKMFRFLELQAEKKRLDAESNRLKAEMDRMKALIVNMEQQLQLFRVYQLDLEGIKTYPFAFRSVEVMRKAGYQQPPAADYRLVYDGEIPCAKDAEPKDVLERIFIRCNDRPVTVEVQIPST